MDLWWSRGLVIEGTSHIGGLVYDKGGIWSDNVYMERLDDEYDGWIGLWGGIGDNTTMNVIVLSGWLQWIVWSYVTNSSETDVLTLDIYVLDTHT